MSADAERLEQIRLRLQAFRGTVDLEAFKDELAEDGWDKGVHDFLSSAVEDIEFLLTQLTSRP